VVIDSSALVAFMMAERSARAVANAMVSAPTRVVAAHTLVETAMVLTGRRAGAPEGVSSDLALVMARFEIGVVPFGSDHWLTAWAAFMRFGKGRHPAALNYGDCLTYAVAKLSGLPLLCVGDDFSQTDLQLVRVSG
jgi:ribonuclease VapC